MRVQLRVKLAVVCRLDVICSRLLGVVPEVMVPLIESVLTGEHVAGKDGHGDVEDRCGGHPGFCEDEQLRQVVVFGGRADVEEHTG